jgi:hypothetical protein
MTTAAAQIVSMFTAAVASEQGEAVEGRKRSHVYVASGQV